MIHTGHVSLSIRTLFPLAASASSRSENSDGGRTRANGDRWDFGGLVELVRLGEQFDLAACLHDGKTQDHWIVENITATNVEEPADRIRRCQHGCGLICFGKGAAQLRDLFLCRTTSSREWLDDDWSQGRRRSHVAPNAINRIGCNRLEFDVARLELVR